MAKKRKCIGYGEFAQKCENVAGTPWSPYWCERCNELRMEAISNGLAALEASFGERRQVAP